MTSPVGPGALAVLHVTFIEDRAGRAIVRLPNGSKTTLDYDALRVLGGSVHFVAKVDRTGETAWCQEQGCGWHHEAGSRAEAEDEYIAHLVEAHPVERVAHDPY